MVAHLGSERKPLPEENLLETVLSKWRLTSRAIWQGIDIGSICKVVQSCLFILGRQILDSNSENIIWQGILKRNEHLTPRKIIKHGTQSLKAYEANLITHRLLSQTPTALNKYLNSMNMSQEYVDLSSFNLHLITSFAHIYIKCILKTSIEKCK